MNGTLTCRPDRCAARRPLPELLMMACSVSSSVKSDEASVSRNDKDGGTEAQVFHHLASCLIGRGSGAEQPFIDESMMSFRPVFGSTSFKVSGRAFARHVGRLPVLVVDVDEPRHVAAAL